MWLPSPSALSVFGLVQDAHAPPSSWHWNVEPDSEEVNANEAASSLIVPRRAGG